MKDEKDEKDGENSWVSFSYLWRSLLIIFTYLVLGSLGQHLALQQVTPLWMPAGVALAAVLIYGYGVFPAIWLGSFIATANYIVSEVPVTTTLIVSMMTAMGATLSALTGGYFLNRLTHGSDALNRVTGVVLFITLGGLLAPVISATIGILSLTLAGFIPANQLGINWFIWWIGEASGIITITPAILIWYKWTWDSWSESEIEPWRYLETIVIVCLLVLVGILSFWVWYPVEYLLILLLIWIVFHLGLKGSSLATLFILGISAWGTVQGYGVFATGSRIESLVLLEIFIIVIAITALLLSAILEERKVHTVALIEAMDEAGRARQRAESANLAKGTFLANMSHEFYTPLNHIVGYCDILKEEVEDLEIDKKEVDTLIVDLEKMRNSSIKLRDLISDILDLSRLEIGKMDLILSEFDVAEAVEEVWSKFLNKINKNKNVFNIQLPVNLGVMYNDRLKLMQTLTNVLENANKFTIGGKVSLSVERQIIQGQEWIVFTVADTGIGIEKSQIEKIFEAFTVLDSSSTRQYSGLGLGLPIAKRYCKLMGGGITIASEPYKGTTCIIIMPASAESYRFDKTVQNILSTFEKK